MSSHSHQMTVLGRTPLVRYDGPGNGWNAIWFKDETCQVSGAFKIRGVQHYFNTHRPTKGVVTASTGNHGTAVAIIARDFGVTAQVFVPTHIADRKKGRLKNAGATVIEYPGSYDECELQARLFAAANDFLFIHSFDDTTIIDGHRSLFSEIEAARGGIQHLFIPVGGGGLLTAALRHYDKGREIYGVEFAEAPALEQSVKVGSRISISLTPNPVEGLCVSQVGQHVFDACMELRPPVLLVTLAEIREAMKLAWQFNGIRCEMAGAASFAAALKHSRAEGECVCILSGGNVDDELFSEIINETATTEQNG